MTRKEAVEILRYVEAHGSLVKEAKEKAIEALEKELCVTMRDLSEEELKHFSEEMKKVRPQVVEQEPKTGHWIETADEYYKAVNEYGGGANENTPYFVDDIACSECLAKYSVIDNETERFDHCPSCGAKMVESQERSGEE